MNKVELKCTEEHIKNSVKEIIKLAKAEPGDVPISLQLVSYKAVKKPNITHRINLTHSLIGDTDKAVLFVADYHKNYKKTIQHWKKALREKKIKLIKEIITLSQIEKEYKEFEERTKLIQSYDLFLVDGKISGNVAYFLGKKAKKPIPIRLRKGTLKGDIEKALKKTSFTLHGVSRSCTVQVAKSNMSEENIIENVVQAVIEIKKVYPGGTKNIRSILIKTNTGAGIPIYHSTANFNEDPVVPADSNKAPVVETKKRKASKAVQGEPPSKKKQNETKS